MGLESATSLSLWMRATERETETRSINHLGKTVIFVSAFIEIKVLITLPVCLVYVCACMVRQLISRVVHSLHDTLKSQEHSCRPAICTRIILLLFFNMKYADMAIVSAKLQLVGSAFRVYYRCLFYLSGDCHNTSTISLFISQTPQQTRGACVCVYIIYIIPDCIDLCAGVVTWFSKAALSNKHEPHAEIKISNSPLTLPPGLCVYELCQVCVCVCEKHVYVTTADTSPLQCQLVT